MNELVGGSEGVHSILYARYGLIDVADTNKGYGPILGELPAGHLVTIVSVRDEAMVMPGGLLPTAVPRFRRALIKFVSRILGVLRCQH